jgi:hypothetical protein
MKVKLRTIFAHPVHGCAGSGEIIELDETTAKALIAERYADAVSPRPLPGKRESAAVSTPETAMSAGVARKTR